MSATATDYRALDALIGERIGRWPEELADFCRISSEATDPNALRMAADWTVERLRTLGASVVVLELDAVPPLVVGEIGLGPRVVTLVQHYDVQPAVPHELWTTPPYEPTVRNGRLYARGATDNKGEFLSRVWGVEAYHDAVGELPCRVRFLVEGEEESGSRNLDRLLDLRPDVRKADGSLIEGGSVTPDGRPWLDCGVRGLALVELIARTAASDIHSSVAPIVRNAAAHLIAALATLRNERGAIALDGFLDKVRPPTAAARAAVRTLPTTDLDEIRAAYGVTGFLLGREGADALEALIFEPTVNIQGLWSGYSGPGAKTVVPAEAHARIDLRLVPDQTVEGSVAALRAHLDRRGFDDIEIVQSEGELPYWSPIDHPIVDAAASVSEAVLGKDAVRSPSMSGTAPMWQVCGRFGVPTVTLGAARSDCMAHAPDENYRIDDAAAAAGMMARFLDAFAAIGR